MSDEEILEFFVQSDDPFLTTTEMAEILDFSNEGAKSRLHPLVDDELLNSKRAGQALCWWITDKGRGYLRGDLDASELERDEGP